MTDAFGHGEEVEAFLDRSQALWAAVISADGAITDASAGLRRAFAMPLIGRAFAELMPAAQRAAFAELRQMAQGADWVSATFALDAGVAAVLPVDRLVHVRAHGAAALVIAEPADRLREQQLAQLLAINDALVTSQRVVAEQQRQLEQAHDDAERVIKRLQTLERITIAATEDDDPGAGLHALLEQARDLAGGQRSSLLLLDEVDDGVAALAGRTGRAIIVADATRDARLSVRERRLDGSLLVVPLRVRGSVIGVLHVGADTAGAFTDEHVAVLAAIGDRAAAVIDRAQHARRERRLAETFQRSLLPGALAAGALELVVHYQPQADGHNVGGDWYDAIAFADGCAAICVGDVAGKGVSAAVTMGQVRSAMHALALNHRDPAELLERLDPFVTSLRTMATVVYALYDPATSTLTYANAGHLPALHKHADGRVDLLDRALSPPLGAGPGARRRRRSRWRRGPNSSSTRTAWSSAAERTSARR